MPADPSQPTTKIGKLDFPGRSNERTRLLSPPADGSRESHSPTRSTHTTTSRSGSFFEQVAEGIQARDRERMKKEVARYGSFAWAILSCLCCGSIVTFSLYGHLFMSELKYSQAAVNMIAIAADLAMYLPVPAFGYLCDRYGPKPLSLFSAVLFGAGYLVAAFAYKSGPSSSTGGDGWPFWIMVVAFMAIGASTSCMYLAAVTTCAKNFGRGKYRGLALALPIAAFGLSGMWLSQVGSHLLVEAKTGDVDVFRYFIFLGCTLLGVGTFGSFALQIVDEEEMIEEAIDELEQSGLLREDEFFRRAADQHGYGTIHPNDLTNSTYDFLTSEAEAIKEREAQEQARKEWLLNAETRRFLSDHTMWWLAAGFFFVTGPGEAFINNMGTIIGTLQPESRSHSPDSDPVPTTTAATHVSIVAITSTVARLLTGTLTDLLAPSTDRHQHRRGPGSVASSIASFGYSPPKPFSISRVVFLLFFALLMCAGQIVLASGVVQNHSDRFWLVSGLIGSGYGAIFSLTPILISVVWGVENFGTNWGIVAMMPAGGAALWGIVYSAVYENAADNGDVYDPNNPSQSDDVLCYGSACYASTFWAMAASVGFACLLWLWAWKGPNGWSKRGVVV